MATWQDYQQEAAQFFRALGLDATVDETIKGVRASHDVDVAVRMRTSGLDQLWVVECKHRQRRIEKLHVAALAEIVRDVGADRGILLSESGFQPGAQQLSKGSNVTVSTLRDLKEQSAGNLVAAGLVRCRVRAALLPARLRTLTVDLPRTCGLSGGSKTLPGVDGTALLRIHAALALVGDGLRRYDADEWPAPYGWDFGADRVLHASTPVELLEGLVRALDDVEREIAAQERAASERA